MEQLQIKMQEQIEFSREKPSRLFAHNFILYE
jgi:hypothetical protein